MNTNFNSSLNLVQYRNEMATLDPTDPEFAHKISSINQKYGYVHNKKYKYNNPSQKHRIYHLKNLNKHNTTPTDISQNNLSNNETLHKKNNFIKYQKPTNYLTNLISPFFGNFNEQVEKINNLLLKFQNHFENSNGPINIDDSTEFDPSEIYKTIVNNTDTQNGYSKYVSSFTSFDSSGQKRSATVSGIEKVINGKRTVSKKIKRIENGVETLEQQFPDGRRITTKRNLTKELPSNQNNNNNK
jgi:hypothetical protein